MTTPVGAVQKAQIVTKLLYESDYSLIKADEALEALEGDARLQFVPEQELLSTPIAKFAATCGLASSNCKPFSITHLYSSADHGPMPAAARQLVTMKGLYINNRTVAEPRQTIQKEDLLDGRLVILRSGSSKQVVLASQ